MSFLTGTKVTDKDIDAGIQKRVRLIVTRLSNYEIDPPDAIRQLTDLIVKATNTRTRTQGREGVE